MKRLLLALCFVLVSMSYASAEISILTWDSNTENDLAGYKLYVGLIADSFTQVVDIPLVSLGDLTGTSPHYNHIVDIVCGDNKLIYYALTAYDTVGNESEKSIIVSKEFDPAPCPPSLHEIIAAVKTLLQRAKLETTITFSEPTIIESLIKSP